MRGSEYGEYDGPRGGGGGGAVGGKAASAAAATMESGGRMGGSHWPEIEAEAEGIEAEGIEDDGIEDDGMGDVGVDGHVYILADGVWPLWAEWGPREYGDASPLVD